MMFRLSVLVAFLGLLLWSALVLAENGNWTQAMMGPGGIFLLTMLWMTWLREKIKNEEVRARAFALLILAIFNGVITWVLVFRGHTASAFCLCLTLFWLKAMIILYRDPHIARLIKAWNQIGRPFIKEDEED